MEDLMYSTEEEQIFWCNAVRGLPPMQGFSGTGYDKFGERIVWGTGSHSLNAFRQTFEMVQPKNVWEIGFQMGYASVVFLEISKTVKVLSCDISQKDETIEAARILKEKYKSRFTYIDRGDSKMYGELKKRIFDMAFIDGGHLKDDVQLDIETCIVLNIPYLLFDDVLPQFGNVQEVIDTFNSLQLAGTWGNIALYKNLSV